VRESYHALNGGTSKVRSILPMNISARIYVIHGTKSQPSRCGELGDYVEGWAREHKRRLIFGSFSYRRKEASTRLRSTDRCKPNRLTSASPQLPPFHFVFSFFLSFSGEKGKRGIDRYISVHPYKQHIHKIGFFPFL
jgi:hypothetical protein